MIKIPFFKHSIDLLPKIIAAVALCLFLNQTLIFAFSSSFLNSGTSYEWVNSGNGNWSTESNWAVVTRGGLFINTGNAIISSSESFTSNGLHIASNAGTQGRLTITGDGARLSLRSHIQLGTGFGGKGYMNISNGGELCSIDETIIPPEGQRYSVSSLDIGFPDYGSGFVTVSGSGSLLRCPIVHMSSGNLIVSDQAKFNAHSVHIGWSLSDSNKFRATITGSNSTFIVDDSTIPRPSESIVQIDGGGELVVENGATATMPKLTIDGSGFNSSLLNISGTNSIINVTGTLISSRTRINIVDGGTLLSHDTNSSANILVCSSESMWKSTGTMFISGTVEVTNGASVLSDSVIVNALNSTKIIISGSDSSWISKGNTFTLSVGSIVISNYGQLSTDSLINGGAYGVIMLEDNGMLFTPKISEPRRANDLPNIYFNGGILCAKNNENEFISNLMIIETNGEGAVINTNSCIITVAAEFTGTGGITKRGEGILTLTANSWDAGEILIESGSLAIKNCALNGAQIHFGPPQYGDTKFGTCIISGNLSGGGTLSMNAYTGIGRSDFINVQGDIIGNYTLNITTYGPFPSYSNPGNASCKLMENETSLVTNFENVAINGTDLVYSGSLWSGNASGAFFAYNPATGMLIVSQQTEDNLRILTSPASQTAVAGSNVSFSVAVDGTPPFAYQWKKNNIPLSLSTATTATLLLESIEPGDAGDYTVTVTNGTDSVASSVATLTVEFAPSITTQLNSQSVSAGQDATFVVAATGIPAPTYQWQFSFNGSNWTNINSTTSATYTISNVTTVLNGMQYRCVATNSQGSVNSNAVTLTVNPDAATVAARELKTALETPGTATVTVMGSVDLSLVGGATVAGGKTIVGEGATSTITGGLTIPASASGIVILGVNFTGGTLTINGAADVEITHCTFTDTPVTITGGADNITFSWNEFTATGVGSGLAMTIPNAGAGTGILLHNNLWGDGLKTSMPSATSARVYMFNNYFTATGNTTATVAGTGAQILSVNNIYEGTHNPLTTQSTGKLKASGNSTPTTTGTIAPGDDEVFVPAYSHIINPAAAATIASITANAGNTAGQSSSTPSTISGTASISATVVGNGASKTNVSANVPVSGGFTLTANASGFEPSARQWYLDNFAIAGATSGTHAVTNTNAAAHAGAYAVALTATTGEIVTSGAFTVTVGALAPPVITTNPVSKTVNVGGSATFTVVATGDALTYQWRRGGTNISGATGASYTISNAQTSHAGNYSVVVSNVSGTATSNAATLTVNTGGNSGNDNNSGGGGSGGAPSLWYAGILACLAALRLRRHGRS